MPHPTVVIAGEVLIDLVSTGDESYVARPGGGPANSAVALARLGARATLLTRLSTDPFGRTLRTWLQSAGVDLTQSVTSPDGTTLAIASVSADGVAEYSFYWKETANWGWRRDELPAQIDAAVDAFHLGSLSSFLPPGAAVLDALLRSCSGRVTTFLDPNFRPRLDSADAARERITDWAQRCDILKVSVDDLAYSHPGASPYAVAESWARARELLVVLTDGSRGAHAFMSDAHLTARSEATAVVDTIGAGDTFGAVFLDSLHARGSLRHGSDRPVEAVQEALALACTGAALSCARPGAYGPTHAELLAAHPGAAR